MEALVRRFLADAPLKGMALMEDTFDRIVHRKVTYLLMAILLLPNIGSYFWHQEVADIDRYNEDGEKVILEVHFEERYDEELDEVILEEVVTEVTVEKRSVGDFLDVMFNFHLQLMLLIVSLSLAIGLIQDEREDRTLPLLMTSPITRFELLLYKYATAVPLITCIIWLPVIVFYLTFISAAGSEAVLGNLGLLGVALLLIFLALAAYTAIFFAIATALKRPLLGGVSFAFLWEIFIGGWDNSFQKITVSHYVRSSAVPLLSEFTGKTTALETLDLLDPSQASLATGWVAALFVMVIVSLSFLILSVLVLRFRDSS